MVTESLQSNATVSFEESLRIAQEIYAELGDEIRSYLQKEIEGVFDYRDYPDLIGHYLKSVPDEDASRFQGHGITKSADHLAVILNIMANKAVKGDWGALKKSKYIPAYTNADFLVLSKKDKNLGISKEDFDMGVQNNNVGMAPVDIGAVVVNAKYYPVVERLGELFPNINIIKASELPAYLKR